MKGLSQIPHKYKRLLCVQMSPMNWKTNVIKTRKSFQQQSSAFFVVTVSKIQWFGQFDIYIYLLVLGLWIRFVLYTSHFVDAVGDMNILKTEPQALLEQASITIGRVNKGTRKKESSSKRIYLFFTLLFLVKRIKKKFSFKVPVIAKWNVTFCPGNPSPSPGLPNHQREPSLFPLELFPPCWTFVTSL